MAQLVVCVGRRQLHLENQAVHLVDHHDDGESLRDRVADHSLRLHHHALQRVDHHHNAVCGTNGCAALVAKVRMPGAIQHVHQEGLSLRALQHERHGRALDAELSLLLVLPRVREAHLPLRVPGFLVRVRYQEIAKKGLPVVQVAHESDVADERRRGGQRAEEIQLIGGLRNVLHENAERLLLHRSDDRLLNRLRILVEHHRLHTYASNSRRTC
eukprot:scaffold8509_cov296-Pinguiococcus_pyrenoidosus.AAC.1